MKNLKSIFVVFLITLAGCSPVLSQVTGNFLINQSPFQPGVPLPDGSAGQVPTTNGSKVISWTSLTNYLADTVGGSGGKPVILTKTSGLISNDTSGGSSVLAPNSQLLTNSSGWTVGGNTLGGTGRTIKPLGSKDSSQPGFIVNNRSYGVLFQGMFQNQGIGINSLANLKVYSDSIFIKPAYGVANTAFGAYTLANTNGLINHSSSNEAGMNNTAIGASALRYNINGFDNTVVGELPLNLAKYPCANTAIGCNSMLQYIGSKVPLSQSGFNVCIGKDCGYGGLSDSSHHNTLGGSYCDDSIDGNASYNSMWGAFADELNKHGSNIVAIGAYALHSNQQSQNVAVGYQSAYNNTSGDSITAIGYQALYNNTTGQSNTAIGYQSLHTVSTTSGNTAIGFEPLANSTGYYNTAVGGLALANATTPWSNTAIGYSCLLNTTTGQNNTSVGYYAGSVNVKGYNNTFIGFQSGQLNNNASSNVSVGYEALINNTADKNTGVGDSAGYGNTSGTGNIYLGYKAGNGSNLSNSLIIATNVTSIQGGSAMYCTPTGQVRDTTFANLLNYLNDTIGGSGSKPVLKTATGTPYIVAKNDLTAQTGAVATVTSFTNGSSIATYRLGGYLNVTAVATDVIQVQVTYTDENNTSQTEIFATNALNQSITNVGNNPLFSMDIRVAASTSVTIKTVLTVGAGSITYDVGGNIMKLY